MNYTQDEEHHQLIQSNIAIEENKYDNLAPSKIQENNTQPKSEVKKNGFVLYGELSLTILVSIYLFLSSEQCIYLKAALFIFFLFSLIFVFLSLISVNMKTSRNIDKFAMLMGYALQLILIALLAGSPLDQCPVLTIIGIVCIGIILIFITMIIIIR